MKNFFSIIKTLKNHKMFVLYSVAYGITGLIIPLGVQFLVNNLALSGIWINITAFLFFITLGLALSQTLKHSMLIILESIQREIFVNEVHKWNHVVNKNHPHYYFEIHNLMKSFSKSYSSLIELGLVLAFGLATIILFHPVFLIASVLILITIWQIYKASESALKSSILESNEKYKIYDLVKAETEISEVQIKNFLQMRDNHFSFIRKNSLKISLLSVVIQSLILITGCYLVNINQLSLGQLVSAEIIVSGIFIAINKLPYSLEAIYDFETSKYKLKKVFGGNDE